MKRFRAAFASLVVVAVLTSFLATWGVVGSLQMSGSPSATTSVTATSASTATETSTSTVTTMTTTTASGPAATTTVTTTATTTGSAGFGLGLFTAGSRGDIIREAQTISLLLAPVAWVAVGGAWAWRGRVRSRYTELGFGSDVFELFMKMKGGATRIKVLGMLDTPKDRLQLAQGLGVDWKTVDRHVQILGRYGFVREQAAFGTVRLYEVTPIGKMLLNLFDDLERTDGPVLREEQRPGNGPGT